MALPQVVTSHHQNNLTAEKWGGVGSSTRLGLVGGLALTLLVVVIGAGAGVGSNARLDLEGGLALTL